MTKLDIQAGRKAQSWLSEQSYRWLGALLLGVVGLYLGVRLSSIYWLIPGIVLGALGISQFNSVVRRRCETGPRRCSLLGLLGVGVGMALVLASFRLESSVIAMIGVSSVIGGLLPLALIAEAAGGRSSARWVAVGGGMTVAGGIAASAISLLLGLVLALIGLAAFQTGIEPFARHLSPKQRVRVAAGSAVALSLGVALTFVGMRYDLVPLATGGVATAGLAFLAFSITWPLVGLPPVGPAGARVFGALAASAGAIFIGLSGMTFEMSLLFAISIVAMGASFAIRGEGPVLAVIVGLGLVWILIGRGEAVPDLSENSNNGIVVAIGDSYTSGEGARSFLPGTNVIGKNECRRSSTAYPYLVAEELEMDIRSYACSGAVTDEILNKPQMPDSPDDVPGGMPQIEYLKTLDKDRVAVLLLTIGGNDALFGEIVKACVFPGTCAEFRQLFLARATTLRRNLMTVYDSVKGVFDGEVPVVVVPYPLVATSEGCDTSSLTNDEHDFIAEFTAVLNDQIRSAAVMTGVHFFDPGMFVFDGARICDNGDAPAAVNFFNLSPPQGPLLNRSSPQSWFHGSMHPTANGHKRLAESLVVWLRLRVLGATAANPEPRFEALERNAISLLKTIPFNSQVIPDEMACSRNEISPFATLRPLLGEVFSSDSSDRRLIVSDSTFRVNARRDRPICYTNPDGSWDSVVPEDVQEGGPVNVDGSAVILRADAPSAGHRQTFVYWQGTDIEGNWKVEVVEICSANAECPTEVVPWGVQQLIDAVRGGTPTITLLFFGGWLFALGTSAIARADEGVG